MIYRNYIIDNLITVWYYVEHFFTRYLPYLILISILNILIIPFIILIKFKRGKKLIDKILQKIKRY